jgi:hypothetical protein
MSEWQSIPGYEGLYEISDSGVVKSLCFRNRHNGRIEPRAAAKILTPQRDRVGYLRIGLRKDKTARQFYIHQLVALAFVGCRPDNLELDHLDAQKGNNSSSNLEYVTHQENCDRALKMGLHPGWPCGEDHARAKLTWQQVEQIRSRYVPGVFGIKRLAKEFEVSKRTIQFILRRRTWTVRFRAARSPEGLTPPGSELTQT